MVSRMHVVKYEAPTINPVFFNSEITDWNFQEKIYKDHKKYCFRFQLIFSNGIKKDRQIGGFLTKKEATLERQKVQAQLFNHEYVDFPSVSVKEFYDFYLYHHMAKEKQCSYSTFMSYRNVIYNYIIPRIGKRKLQSIRRDDIMSVLSSIESKNVLRIAQGVISGSFKYAKAKQIIVYNHSAAAIRDNKQRIRMAEKLQAASDVQTQVTSFTSSTYSIPQVCKLLQVAKEQESFLFLPLLVTLTSGLRISELIALKYEDINYTEKTLYVTRQLGRKLEFMEPETEHARNQECEPKSQNGIRTILLPQLTLDEIILEKKRRMDSGLKTSEYIFTDKNGNTYHRSSFRKAYRKLVEDAKLPYIRWHDLRHTYATILNDEQISLKAISSSMGHGSEQLTKEVYIEEDPTKHVCTALDYMKTTIDRWIEKVKEDVPIYSLDLQWDKFLPLEDEISVYSLDFSWKKLLPNEDKLTVYDLYSPWKDVI